MSRTNPAAAESREHRDLSFGQAYSHLQQAQKSSRGAPGYSRWVNRPIGRVFAAAAYRMGLVPNQVTAISALFTYAAIAMLALVTPNAAVALVVTVLLLIGYALDSADGQLARLTRSGRPSGEWLDHVIDMGKLCLLHGAIAISWVRWGASDWDFGIWSVAAPILFLAVTVVGFFGWLLSDLLIRVQLAGRPAQAASSAGSTPAPASVLRSLLRLPGDYGLLVLTFIWFATPFFAVSYLLLLAANAAILALALPVWFRQVQSTEEAA